MNGTLRTLLWGLTSGLGVALLDLVLSAHVRGVALYWAAAPAIATPALLLIVACTAASLPGVAASWIPKRLLGSSSLDSLRIALSLAGPSAVLVWVAGVRTPAWAAAPPKLQLFWVAAAVACGAALGFASEATRERARLRALTERVFLASPLLLCFAFSLQGLRSPDHADAPFFAAAAVWLAAAASVLRSWPHSARSWLPAAVYVASAGALISVASRGSVPPPLELGPAPATEIEAGRPRHVILITIDTLRRDALGVYGREGASPEIDRLADDSIVFDRAYSSAPWTLPAMTGILTGVSPWEHRAHTWADLPPAKLTTLAERLRAAGYETAMFGRNAVLSDAGARSQLMRGFDYQRFFPLRQRPKTALLTKLVGDPPYGYGLDVTTVELTGLATQWIEQRRDSPFFLWLHYLNPHVPYAPPVEYLPEGPRHPEVGPVFDHRLLSRARKGEWRPGPDAMDWVRKLYQAEVRYVDDNLGRFLERCRALDIYDDALIVLSSDHGDEFFEHGGLDHGHTLYNELLRVPLMIKPPGADIVSRRVDERVSTLSIPPTILRLGGVNFDSEDFSASGLQALLVDNKESVPEGPQPPVFATGLLLGVNREAVVFEKWKLIRNTLWNRVELYDLDADPGETANLAPLAPKVVELGEALLRRYAAEAEQRRKRLGLGSVEKIEITDRDVDLLRSLGYIQ